MHALAVTAKVGEARASILRWGSLVSKSSFRRGKDLGSAVFN